MSNGAIGFIAPQCFRGTDGVFHNITFTEIYVIEDDGLTCHSLVQLDQHTNPGGDEVVGCTVVEMPIKAGYFL